MSYTLKQWIRRLTLRHYAVGVEVTDTSLKIAEVELTANGPILSQQIVEPLLSGTMDDGRVKEPLGLIQSLQSAINRLNLKAKNIHLAIPSQTTMVRFLKLPDVSDNDMYKLIDLEIKHNIHLPFEDPLYDFIMQKKIKAPISKSIKLAKQEAAATSEADPLASLLGGSRQIPDSQKSDEDEADPVDALIDVMMVAAPKEVIHFYMEWLSTCKLKPASIEIKALSLYRLINWNKQVDPKSTFIIADITETTSDLSIFSDGYLKITRSVPISFGSEKNELNQDVDPIMALLGKYNETDTDANWTNGCNDLGHEIERLMNFYRYTLNNREQNFDAVILTGDVRRMDEIAPFLDSRLNIPASNLRLQWIESKDNLSNREKSEIAVSIGLALRGLEE